MEMVQRTLEVERIVNLVAAFEWKVVKEEVVEDKIVITIEKTISSEPVPVPAP